MKRVFARTGVKPMLYTSPNFWHVNMADTRWFADHGYPLWIAHWNVPAPSVPAEDWGGHGWTFWQWTSTGHVSGIVPEVDRDRYNGTNLLRGTIASLEVTPPGGRCHHRRADRLRRRRPDVQPAREPGHAADARRHARSGRFPAPMDRGVQRRGLGANLRGHGAGCEDGLGRVRVSGPPRTPGER